MLFPRPILDALLAIALLSVMDAIIKELVGRLPVAEVAFLRYAVGSLVMTAIVSVRRPGWPRIDTVRANALRAVLVVVTALSFFYALGQLPLAETLILSFVSPLFTALLAVTLLRERLHARILLAIAAGFAGVLVIVVAGQGGGEHAELAQAATRQPILGVVAVLISAFTYAASNVLLRARAQRDHVLIIVLIQNWAPACMIGLPAWYFWQTPSGRDLGLLLVVGLLGVAGHLLLARAYAAAEATRLAALEYTALIWATALGFFWFSEIPSLWAALGAALILAGAYAGARARR
jgi:drug/metabolite transporter (DMT)-like permease